MDNLSRRSFFQGEVGQGAVVGAEGADFLVATQGELALEDEHLEAGALAVFEFLLFRLVGGLGELAGLATGLDLFVTALGLGNRVVDLDHDALFLSLELEKRQLSVHFGRAIVVAGLPIAEGDRDDRSERVPGVFL